MQALLGVLTTNVGVVTVSNVGIQYSFIPGLALDFPPTTLTPGLYTDTDVIYSATVQLTGVMPPLFVDADTIFSTTVTVGAVTLAPLLVTDSTESIYSPTATFYALQTLVSSLVADTDTFFAPTLTPGAVTLSPPLVPSGDSILTPRVDSDWLVTSASVGSDDVVYAPGIGASDALLPNLVNDMLLAEVIFSMATFQDQRIQPALRVDTDLFYSPSISVGAVIAPSLYSPGDTIYTPVVVGRATLPSLFTDVDTFYVPVLVQNSTLHPPLVTDAGVIQPGEVFFQTPIQTPGGGGSGAGLPADLKYASSILVPQSGRIVGLYVTSTTAAPTVHVRMGVYDNGPSGVPNNLIGFTDILTGVVMGQNSLPITSPFGGVSVAAGQTVWLAVNTDGTMNWFLANSPNGAKYNTNTFTGGLSDPFGKVNNDNRQAPVAADLLIGNQQVSLTANTVVSDVAEQVLAATVSTINTLLPVLVDDTPNEAVIQPNVSGNNQVEPQLGVLAGDDTVYSPSVFEDKLIFAPLVTDITDVVYQPVVQSAPVQISSAQFLSDDVIYQPTVIDRGANVTSAHLISDDVFYVPIVASAGILLPSLFDDSLGDLIYAPTVIGATWTFSPVLVDDSQYEFLWPPTVQNLDTNFAITAPIVVDTDRVWRPNVFFPGELALTGIVLIASEEDRENDLLGDGGL